MINPLNTHFSFTNPASIHDEEALTALELAGRQSAKINEVVKDHNALRQETEEHLEQQDTTIDNRLSEQDNRLTAQEKTQIPATVTAEMQRQINNGTFDREINTYAGNLTERVDNLFSKVVEGSTTMDAEVLDTRVSYENVTYDSAGNAVRSQFRNMWNGLDSMVKPLALKPIRIYPRKYIGESGALWDSTDCDVKEYAVNGGETYYFSRMASGRDFVRFYGSDMVQICKYTDIAETFEALVTIPENCCFIRLGKFDDDAHFDDFIMTEENYNLYGGKRGLIKSNLIVEMAEKAGDIVGLLPVEKTTLALDYMIFNLLNPNTILNGQYCNFQDGSLPYNESYFCTDLISIGKNQTLKVVDRNMTPVSSRMACGYDKYGNFVKGVENQSTFTQSDNIASVRFSLPIGEENNIMITDQSATFFMVYGELGVFKPDAISMPVKNNRVDKSKDTLNAYTSITLENFPAYLKNGQSLSFSGKFTTFDSVTIGKGYNTYRGHWVKVDATNITHYRYENSLVTVETVEHGLSISDYISIMIDVEGAESRVSINSTGGTFTHTFDWQCEACGDAFVSGSMEMTDCKLSATSRKLNHELWMFGDSYFGANTERVIGQLKNLGFFENILVDGLAGQGSPGAYKDLVKCLNLGTPKYLVWCLGMNDSDSNYSAYLEIVKSLCESKNITLILSKIPTVPERSKEAINEMVVNAGLRYVDSYKAVGANSSGEWYAGYLSGDNVHPTELGAKAIAMQMLVDVPEIMAY